MRAKESRRDSSTVRGEAAARERQRVREGAARERFVLGNTTGYSRSCGVIAFVSRVCVVMSVESETHMTQPGGTCRCVLDVVQYAV